MPSNETASNSQNGHSSSKNGHGKASSSIQVVVRLRPMNSSELEHGTLPVVTASTEDRSVTVIKGQGTRQVRSHFSFDHVFTGFSTQEEVFDATLQPVIDDVMMGFESTVFAYGQTGTGKTYTMEGDLGDEEMFGVIPRCARAIFERLEGEGDGDGEYSSGEVTCSYLEIYNEELSDLLSDETQSAPSSPAPKRGTKLEIREGKGGTCCRGLSERSVTSAEDVLKLMRAAQRQRKIGETKMNKASSRSHCLFTIKVSAKKTLTNGDILEFNGKLHLVDLAGSESAKTASLTGGKDKELATTEATRGRERMNINRSLLTLGRVIKMLKEKQDDSKKNVFIPYRESKLTRILQEALGGRSKTVIVATLSPSITAVEESISTLNYAQWANGITNKPVSTSYLSVNPNASLATPKTASGSDGCGITVEDWNDMECRLAYMQAQVEEAQGALARKHLAQQVIIDRAEQVERENEEFKVKVECLESDLAEVRAERNDLEDEKTRLNGELTVTKEKLTKQTSRAEKAEADFAESEETRARENAEAAAAIAALESSLAAMTAEKERLEEELASTQEELERQIARAEKAEAEAARLARELDEANATIAELRKELVFEIDQKLTLAGNLRSTEIELRKTAAVLDATRATEQKLTNEALALLDALKHSIAESESLHGLVVQSRTKESELRAETRVFNKSAVAVLHDVTAFINKLSDKTEEYRDAAIGSAEDEHSAHHAALEGSLALVAEIGKKVGDLTRAMKDKVDAPDDGLLARVSQTSAQVSKGLTEASDTLAEGERVLAGSCQSAQDRLVEHSENVKALERRFVEDSDGMLKAMEENLTSSKGRLVELTTSATDAIDAAVKERAVVREALSEVLSRWNESSLQWSSSLGERAKKQTEAMSSSLDKFGQSMRNHDEVSEHLSAQKAFVVEKGDRHLGDISLQASLLEEQKDGIVTTHQHQKQLCDNIIKNVMEGVRQLVTGQMALLTKDQEECFASLEQQNDGLVVMNKNMGETAKNVFDTVDETNVALVKKGEQMKLSDEEAVSAMTEANEVFVTLKGIAEEHTASTATFKDIAGGKVGQLAQVDTEASAKIVAGVRKGGDVCSENLTEQFDRAKDNLSTVTASGKEISTFAETGLIPSASEALNKIADPRPEVASNLKSTFERISTHIKMGEAAVRSTADEQRELMTDLRTAVELKEEEYAKVAAERREDIDSRRERTLHSVTTYGNEASAGLGYSKSHTEKVRISIQDFSTNVMQAEEDVEAAPAKLELPYSEDFSVTAPQEDIWKTLSFATIDSELFGTIGNGDIAQHLPALVV